MIVATFRERPDLAGRLGEIGDPWPEFMHHGDATNRFWGRLFDEFLEYQLVLYDEELDLVAGKGHTIPVAWDGTVEGLPDGVDDALEHGVLEGASALCAIVAVVDPGRQGEGLSGTIIEGMRWAAARHGLSDLIAPVRPTWKRRYPLTPMERYVRWRRADHLPFDPWIRLHERLGGELLAVCPRSITVTATVAEWEEWTGIPLPESGSYVVGGALVPVEIDREHDTGRYVEPNVWMRHRARRAEEPDPAPGAAASPTTHLRG